MSIRENATLHMAFNVDGPQTFMDYTVSNFERNLFRQTLNNKYI